MKSLILILLLFSLINIGSAAVFNVNEGESIQSAVDNATYGDIVYVHNGTYIENILITQSIALVGKNATIYGNSSTDDVITVAGDGVHVVGFNISGIYNGDKAGIQLYGADHSLVADNTISMGYTNYYAIRSDVSYNLSIINNTLYDNSYGIRLGEAYSTTISGNTITNNRYRGIRLYDNASDTLVENNNISSNGYIGVELYKYSNNNTIIGNTINSNGYNGNGFGIYVSYICDGTNIINNTIQYNTFKGIAVRDGSINTSIIGNNVSYNDGIGGGNAIHIGGSTAIVDRTIIKDNVVRDNPNVWNAAIYIWEGRNNSVINNTVIGHNGSQGAISLFANYDTIVSDNDVNSNIRMIYGGLTLYSCRNTTVTRNVIVNNSDYNIHILYNGNNTIYDNYIGGNVSLFIYEASTVNRWNVTSRPGPNIIGGPEIGGNYYTDYNGTDLNNDGFGDLSYLIHNNYFGSDDYDHLPLMIPGDDPVSCGDASGDGNTNIIDVIEVYRHVCNPSHALVSVEAADVNCDSKVNIIDVIEIYRHVCNPSHTLNCC